MNERIPHHYEHVSLRAEANCERKEIEPKFVNMKREDSDGFMVGECWFCNAEVEAYDNTGTPLGMRRMF